MRIIFAGTPEFAVPPLELLLNSSHELVAVYTQPDRPAGRGHKLRASPVKLRAESGGFPVFQPKTLKDPAEQERLRALAAEVMIVAAYGLILPQAVLDLPRLGCINIHASLLPRWRGAAPIQRALLAGDAQTGITIMRMELSLDTGPMLYKKTCRIGATETAGELHDRLARLGAEALAEVLPDIEAGTLRPEAQDDSQASYACKLEKHEAPLDWSRPAIELERQVRALNPWPVAETLCRDGVLRIWRAQALDEAPEREAGTVLNRPRFLDIATGRGILRVLEVQLPGGKRMSAEAFLHAHPIHAERLGKPV